MGVFQETVQLVNRAPVNLTVTFDGQSKTLVPGVNSIPQVSVSFAKNQNPIMGSHDPYNPHANGARYLVGVIGSKDPIEPLTEAEWEAHLGAPTRDDFQRIFDDKYSANPKARLVIKGAGKKTSANSVFDAGGSPQGNSEFTGKA
jgi:hypothetical protein